MKRFGKIMTSVLLISSMLLVSACGNSSSNDEGEPNNMSGQVRSDAGNSADIQTAKYDPAITVSLVGVTDDTLEGVLAKLQGESFEDNRWTKLYEDQLGIKFKYNWIAKGPDQFKQKMNVSLATGDVPEFIQVDAIELKQLQEADLIMDLGELYEKYAAPLTKEVLAQDGEAPFKVATIDGKLMGLPNVRSSIDMAQFVWIRTDWLNKLGLSEPKSMDDLLDIIEAFTTQDPDGNGQNDTVGLLVQKDLFGGFAGLEGFFNAYHAYPTVWVKDENGQIIHGSTRPEVKTALAELQKMYQKGQLDKEFGVKDWGKTAETASAGKAGVAFGQQWLSAWPFQSNHDNDPNAVWKAYPLLSIDSQPAKSEISLGTTQYWAVRKDAAHPEALIKMFNLYIEKNWGETAEFDTYYLPGDAEGTWKLSPVTPEPPNKNLDAYLAISEATSSGSVDQLKGEAKVILDKVIEYKSGNQGLWSWYAGSDPVEGVYRVMKQYKDQDLFQMNEFVSAPTPTMTDKSATLTRLMNETFMRIILGDLKVDAFDKYVEDWNKLGGEQITKEVNEIHKAGNK
ncbi:extracellular solute-binding protein [Paenibacillus sp. D2_2]|uniref:extracellular solute-binding protein n=1 Tax=Paenibacillus sp. D2_2 TaxID=3073092 RepID=UPI0028156A80|nr:extracellular solute-binding protein [Paenibacillus sp. D2_2]WMT39583.1 extracellular solute-binding protein [Paenibacillus sp. D2_2]